MMLLVSSFEVGMANLRNTMLERATDFAVRDVRLGAGTPPTHESLKLDICNNAGIIPDCMNRVQIELNRVDTSTWATLANSAQCIDRSSNIEPVIQFVPGQQNDLMLVRVCVVFDPFFPTFGLGLIMPKNAAGDYALVANSAFVIEPL